MVLALSVLTVALTVGPATMAGADTESDLNAARKTADDAQAVATAATSELIAAETRQGELQSHIADLGAEINAARQHATELQILVNARAVYAYKHAGKSGADVLFTGKNLAEALRRQKVLEITNAKADKAIDELAALQADLRDRQRDLTKERAQVEVLKNQLAATASGLQAKLTDAQKARDALANKLAAEKTAAAAAELARLRAANPVVSGQPGQIIVNPGGGSFQCPVGGAAYSDNYGPRGSGFHYGIDMFATSGGPEVAVKAGTVRYVANEGDGGNTAYLSANDGNVYFYAHLSAFVGGGRSVAQGEVIGRVGQTGNASAPHLHFEIRLGGANGQRIDPFPTLQGAGC
jgi:murein DD-endopeptidase MepM/ murein hydrolase activator NlpD